MDTTLLETARAAESPHTNNDAEQRTYRELVIERPQDPLRMRVDPPVEYDGKLYSEMIFDWDAMIGKDFLRAQREFDHLYKPDKNETIVIPESKHLYHDIIAAHRANVPLGVIQKLPRRWYVPLRTEALKACGSSPDKEE